MSVKQRSIEEYLQLPYRMKVSWDEDYWAVEFPELPYLAAAADTWEELPGAIAEAKRVYFESMLVDQRPIPEPEGAEPERDGTVHVRLPKKLHAQAERASERDEVSLHAFIVAAVASAVGRERAARFP